MKKGCIIDDKVILGWLPNKFANRNLTTRAIEDEILYQLICNHLEYLYGYWHFKEEIFLEELLKQILNAGCWYYTNKDLNTYTVGKIDEGYINILYKPKKMNKRKLNNYLLKSNLINNNFDYFCIEDIKTLIFNCIKSDYYCIGKIEQLSQNMCTLFYLICKNKFKYSEKELEKYTINVTDNTRLNLQVGCNYIKLTNGYCYLNASDVGKNKDG